MFVEVILLLVLLASIFHYRTRYGRIGRLVENIPGLPAWPLVGSLPYLKSRKREEMWQEFRKFNDKYYPIFKFWTTHEVVINLRHPDDVEVLLSSMQHIGKSTAYRLLQPWLKTGLLTSTGSKWQKRRKILTPAFHFNVLKKYMDIIVENSEKIVETLKSNEEKENTQNLLQFSTNYTLNVICEAAMGISLHGLENIQKKYRNAIHVMGDIVVHRIARPWLRKESIFRLTKKGHEQAEALEVLHGFSKKIMDERKEYHNQTNDYYLNQFFSDDGNDNNVEIFGVRKKRLAMLDLLISLSRNGQIDDEGIQEEVDTFVFEGHDTAAMGLSYALLLLAEHKNIQEKARAEVKSVFEKSGEKIGYSEVQQLVYLEMCIKESLRLYPSVPFLSRKSTEDLQLKNYLIPGGAIIHVHVYDLHRDPNFWPDPNKFDPDRFLSDKIKNRHPFSYIPFSAGPRNCIGQKFVMMELKTSIAHLLHNFILEPIDFAHEIPIMTDLVLRPSKPMRIKFIPIQN